MSSSATVVQSSAQAAGLAGARFGTNKLRNSLVAAFSAAVIMAGALFVALPSQTGVAFAVSAAQIDGKHSVVYGEVVDRTGAPVRGARVSLIRWVNGDRRVLFSSRTGKRGLYRFELRAPRRDEYNLRVGKIHNERKYVGVRTIKMRPGLAFEVPAKLVKSGRLFFLPVSTY